MGVPSRLFDSFKSCSNALCRSDVTGFTSKADFVCFLEGLVVRDIEGSGDIFQLRAVQVNLTVDY
jgi:hypothetical protein